MLFFVFYLWPNKISCLLLNIFVVPFLWQCCLPLHFTLPPVLVVVGGPSLLGPSSCMSFSGSFKTILPILLPMLMPLHSSLCCILHILVHFSGAFLVSLCWILVLGKNILQLCFVPVALICRMHPSKCIRVNVDNNSAFSVFCYCVWMCCAVIYKLSYLFCGFNYQLFLYLRQGV